jgi:probable RNA-binding protein EIF1AD
MAGLGRYVLRVYFSRPIYDTYSQYDCGDVLGITTRDPERTEQTSTCSLVISLTTFCCNFIWTHLHRRTHYRKHLTDAVLNDLPEPKEYEKVARVVATRGGNQFDICVANDNTVCLAILPTKFHKLVWVKRGDYVLVAVGADDEAVENEAGTSKNKSDKHDEGGIRHMISHILYKDQIKHLKSKGLWPEDDPEFSNGTDSRDVEDNEDLEDDDGIVYQDYDDNMDDDIFVNTNRVAKLEVQDSSDDSDDE